MIKSGLLIVLSCFAFVACISTNKSSVLQKPNILFIHIDDLGFHDLSIHGSKIYQTPNIDELALESYSFQKAYSNYPRCVPSRYAMLTASYPIKEGNVPDDGFDIGGIADESNFIRQLKRTGYHTTYYGKWHLGSGDSSPRGFGFDQSYAAGKAGSPISYFYPFNQAKGKNRNVKKSPIPEVDENANEGDYLTDHLSDKLINDLNDSESDVPFFKMIAFYTVHQPIEAKEEDKARNEQEIGRFDFGNQPEYITEGTGRTKMRQDNAAYAGMVENLDWNIGRILECLEKLNISENTIIIFSSDHGGLSNDGYNKRNLATSNFPLRAGKGWFYEGGIKVPLFIKWKNQIKPKTDNESIIMLMDLFPTILDITASNPLENIDGNSFLPVIEGKELWGDRTLYWHSSKARPRNTGEHNASVIREGKYKLLNFYEEDKIELYDLNTDPYEKKNLAAEEIIVKNRLLERLNNWKNNF